MEEWFGKKKIKKMKKLSIKEIFSEEEKLDSKPIEADNTNSQDKRMAELAKALDLKGEVYKEEKQRPINENKIKKEFDRFRKVAKIDEALGNVAQTHPQGGLSNLNAQMNNSTLNTSVNSFMQTIPGKTVNTFLDNPNMTIADKNHNPNYTYLQPAEALRLSISRVLSSGAPVGDMGFYDEVNWNLNRLGFFSKSPLDIKQAILKMIKD